MYTTHNQGLETKAQLNPSSEDRHLGSAWQHNLVKLNVKQEVMTSIQVHLISIIFQKSNRQQHINIHD